MILQKFKVLVCGDGFKFKNKKDLRIFGFFTTRFVEAINPDSAASLAISLVGEELNSLSISSGPFCRIVVDEVKVIESFEGINSPGAGFTWYPQSKVSFNLGVITLRVKKMMKSLLTSLRSVRKYF